MERACIGRRAPAGAYQVGPWTINADQPSKAAAVGMVRAMQLRGVRVIDVGCFQVDLFYHLCVSALTPTREPLHAS